MSKRTLLRGALVSLSAVALTAGTLPAAGAQPDTDGPDFVIPGAGGDRLAVPEKPAAGQVHATGRARYTYGLSYVAIPIKGERMGFSRKGIKKMTKRVGARMVDQTAGRFKVRMHAFEKAPSIRSSRLACDVERLYKRYRSYTSGTRRTPAGLTDVIAVFLTPLRYKCNFAGLAVLGGTATYLNGIDVRDPQRLQDWITAHELGHNLGLVNSGSFHPADGSWTIGNLRVPEYERNQDVREYGDYLDVMGQPPNGGYRVRGADFGKWAFDSISMANLGVLADSDITRVRRSGSHTLAPLRPGGVAGDASMLAIPIVADGAKTYWVLEYRPVSESAASGLDYPEPWLSAGFGVRLIEAEHSGSDFYSINKVFHPASGKRSPAHLPVGTRVLLGGGSSVTVKETSERGANVEITVPESVEQTVKWPPARRIARAGVGDLVWLPQWTRQGRTIRWRVTDGPCWVERDGSGRYSQSYLVKDRRTGACELRARAKKVSFAFFTAYERTARYTFSGGAGSRELLP